MSRRVSRFLEIFAEWLDGEIDEAVTKRTEHSRDVAIAMRDMLTKHACHLHTCSMNDPNEFDTCPCSCGLRDFMADLGYEENWDDHSGWRPITP